MFARAVSSTGYPLSTPHGITSVIKGEPNWSGSSTNRVCVACSRVWKFRLRIGAKRSAINTSNVPPRDDCSSRPAVPVLPFRPAARPRGPRGRQLGTTHAQQRTGTASVSRSGASGGSVYAAARCASTARFVIRHLRPKRPVRGSSGFRRAGAFGHPRRSPQRMTRIDGAGPGVRMRGAASSRPSRPLPRTDSGPPSRSTPPVHRLINFTTHCTAARG